MTGRLDKFLMRKGEITADDLLGACLIAWICGIGATLVGCTLIGIVYKSILFSIFLLFFSVFTIPIGIIVSLPVVFIVQSVRALNGLSMMLVGLICASPITISLFRGAMMPEVGLLVAFVGVSAGAAAWHAGANYYDDFA